MKTSTLCGGLLLLVAVPAFAAANEAEQWLDKMSHAVQNLSYEGTFVYLQGGHLEAMRIIHRGGVDGEQERLVSLTGVPREVIRNNQSVTCILPDSKSVMVEKSLPRKPFPAALPRDLDDLTRDYQFLVLGSDRMAGRSARVIAIKPRDRYRYGYRLWLDKATNLPLKSDLADESGHPVEQVMFTNLQVRDDIPDAALKPALSGEDYTRYQSTARSPAKGAAAAPDTGWKVTQVPDGFILTHHSRHTLPPNKDRVEHLVYSDGLATVSVYIEKPGSGHQPFDGTSRMGAVNAYGRMVDGHQITVVGEVPMATVKMIGRSVRQEQP